MESRPENFQRAAAESAAGLERWPAPFTTEASAAHAHAARPRGWAGGEGAQRVALSRRSARGAARARDRDARLRHRELLARIARAALLPACESRARVRFLQGLLRPRLGPAARAR